jgi:hypothetical protein
VAALKADALDVHAGRYWRRVFPLRRLFPLPICPSDPMESDDPQ